MEACRETEVNRISKRHLRKSGKKSKYKNHDRSDSRSNHSKSKYHSRSMSPLQKRHRSLSPVDQRRKSPVASRSRSHKSNKSSDYKTKSCSGHMSGSSHNHTNQSYNKHFTDQCTTHSRNRNSPSNQNKRSCSDHNTERQPIRTPSVGSKSDSEEEIQFSWEDHRYELNQMFFRDEDVITRGSVAYKDFWQFATKYQAMQRQHKIKSMCNVECSKSDVNEELSPILQLPQKYDKKYAINFALNVKDVDELKRRLPPRDLDEKSRHLSSHRILEFKFIILLYVDFLQRQKFDKLRRLRDAQTNLPIAEYQDEIVSTVCKHSVVIIAGDTGCGKSTQVPQYLLAAGFNKVACTQPRRIACISLCNRVSYETLNEYGSRVGYQIRFERRRTEQTRIVFLTEGLLLRQVSTDPTLSAYDVLILDEIHERHLHTDFLLGVVKCLVLQRPDVKVILMSATINIELFQRYFAGSAPVIQVPGRLYPIVLKYCPVPATELMQNARRGKSERLDPAPYVRLLQLIDDTYPVDERGDLLVFLSGVSDISTVLEAARLYAARDNRWVVLPLHSTLSISEQEKVFDVPPEGVRKCIVSTNIAETSVTIDGVRFVADSGKVKEMSYDAVSKLQRLKEFWISQASAEQRKGRAGRTGPGVCYRLYSAAEYDEFAPYSAPEIRRVPLDSLVLQTIAMGLPDVRLFPFVEPPPMESLELAIAGLKAQAALTSCEVLTTIGRLLSELPMDISLGKMLIMGSLFHQVEPVLSLAAAMSVQSPFTNRAFRDPDCALAVKSLESDHGDPFTLLNSYKEWLGVKLDASENTKRWCHRRGLEEQRFYEMTKLRAQFAQMLQDSGLHRLAAEKTGSQRLTGAERAKRFGELRQLKELQKELKQESQHKVKVLKIYSIDINDDEDDGKVDAKDIDFRIRNDSKQMSKIYLDSDVRSFKDVLLLKVILCAGLYPQVAIADDHNTYKQGSEQVFHTATKPGIILHPNSVFSSQPEILQVKDCDMVELPGTSTRQPVSSRHQLLAYVSLLETNKAYLVDTLRVPAAQTLLLFAREMDTNGDMSVVVCDRFLALNFPDPVSGQDLIFRAVQLRFQWQDLLDMRLQATQPAVVDQEKLSARADQLETDLTTGLLDFYSLEPLFSVQRLLAADIKVLHTGSGPGDCILSGNPFSKNISCWDNPGTEENLEACCANPVKGGYDLTDFLCYNCLFETQSQVTTIGTFDSVCPYCDDVLTSTTLGRLAHMSACVRRLAKGSPPSGGVGEREGVLRQPNAKEYFCEECGRMLWLSVKDIFKHKKSH